LLQRCVECRWPEGFELILVDNGSTDGTSALLRSLAADRTYPFLSPVYVEINRGYGDGILQGLRAARGSVLAWTHADLQTDIADVRIAYDLYEARRQNGRCVVKGRRRGRPLADCLLTGGMSLLSSVVLGTVLRDVNAQPKLFGRDVYRMISNAPEDFSLDLYWYVISKRARYAVYEFPVSFGKRTSGISKSAPNWSGRLRTIWRTVLNILRLRVCYNGTTCIPKG